MKKLAPLLTWLKEAAQNLLSLLKGLVLVPLAIILLCIAIPAGAIHYACTIKSRKQKAREVMTNTGTFSFLVAYSIDCFGNVVTPGLWNWLFLKDQNVKFKFGVPGQSLSLIIGWNERLNNLTEWGVNLYFDLEFIDPNHCEKAIEQSLVEARTYLLTAREVMEEIEKKERTKEFIAKYN